MQYCNKNQILLISKCHKWRITMKTNTLLLHIPHSSTKLTKEFKMLNKTVDNIEIEKFNQTITDLFKEICLYLRYLENIVL